MPGITTASFNLNGLTAGTYNGAVTISSAAAVNSPVVVPVTLVIAAAPTCSFGLGSTSVSVAAAGGLSSVSINTTAGCNWSASTSDSWIHFTSAGSGTGP